VTKNNFYNIKVLLTNGTPEITRARKIATLNDDCKFGLVFANLSTIFLKYVCEYQPVLWLTLSLSNGNFEIILPVSVENLWNKNLLCKVVWC